MRILYVAKHNSGDNDDEGAIAYALEQLGHEVIKVHELRKHRASPQPIGDYRADLCLFHKWATVSEILQVNCPKVFWYFDMVTSDDPTLAPRSQSRVEWMNEVIPHCLLGFCTDGDWVRYYGKNLRHLMQGADERYVGFGETTPEIANSCPPILFTGMINHGQKRAQHIAELRAIYGDRFTVMGDGGPRHRRHGRELANVFAATKIVVAPNGPNTDNYWSNRVYLTLGLGGFLLHPYCEKLSEQYAENELVRYRSNEELISLIDYYLEHDDEREAKRIAGLNATKERNLYRHRCEQLLKMVEEAL